MSERSTIAPPSPSSWQSRRSDANALSPPIICIERPAVRVIRAAAGAEVNQTDLLRFDFRQGSATVARMSAESATVAVEPVVTLTENAARQVATMLAGESDAAGKRLRIFVEAGGCSGMQYGMTFDEARDEDLSADFGGVGVVVDPFSAEYVRGAVIDFSDELTGGGFKINNPRAASSCGCGKSFSA